MRKIEFRGKRADNEKWITNSETFIRDGDGVWLSDENGNVVKVVEETVGQYTGLEDKNKVSVFEGDKVISTAYRPFLEGEVIFEGGVYKLLTDTEMKYFLFQVRNIKVVGNIHDNEELSSSEIPNN